MSQPNSNGGIESDSLPGQPPNLAGNSEEITRLDTSGGSGAHIPQQSRPTQYIGDYELLTEIARGGMGVVYKARQRSLNRIVALKMILAGKFASTLEVRRFKTEAEAAANLQHPNIVSIHEVGQHEGLHYFSMDYINGRNLAEFLAESEVDQRVAAGWIQKMADAIQYAHQRGVLHRDLKPQNVLLDERGEPRVTDFGLAKQTRAESDLTHTGAVVGSPAYMPPEQASGRHDQVGPHSDVYSLGAILYQLLTGSPPFKSDTPVETMRMVVQSDVIPPGRLNQRLSGDLETICLKCLEKDPARRYPTARDLSEDLGRYLRGEGILARRAGAARRGFMWLMKHPWIITGAASLLLFVTAGLAYGMWEKVNALAWKSSNPGLAHPYVIGHFFPHLLSVLLIAEFLILQGIPISIFLGLRARRIQARPVFALFAIIGCAQGILGLEVLRRAVAAHAWNPGLGIQVLAASACAMSNLWFGSALAWKALVETRPNLPGLNSTQDLVEHPVSYGGRSRLTLITFRWLGAGFLFSFTAGLFVDFGTDGMGFIFGLLGMAGVTGLMLLGRLMAFSTGLERQALMPLLTIPSGLTLLSLTGLASAFYFVIPAYWIAGILLGRSIIKQCPLQRGTTPVAESCLRIPKSLWIWSLRIVKVLAWTAAITAAIYLLENIRGVMAWQKAVTRKESQEKWTDFRSIFSAPRPPDEQNAFKHPFMVKFGLNPSFTSVAPEKEWFSPPFIGYWPAAYDTVPLRLLQKMPVAKIAGYRFKQNQGGETHPKTNQNTIRIKDAPLRDAVQQLAAMTGIQLKLGDKAEAMLGDQKGNSILVSFETNGVAGTAALEAFVDSNRLQLLATENPGEFKIDLAMLSLSELQEHLRMDDMPLQQLGDAIRRPSARLDWNPETDSLFSLPVLNAKGLQSAARSIANRSKLLLFYRQPEAAFVELKLIRELAEFCDRSVPLGYHFTKAALVRIICGVIQEGIEEHLWPEEWLARAQEELLNMDILQSCVNELEAQRTFTIEALRRLCHPMGYKTHSYDFFRLLAQVGETPTPEEKRWGLFYRLTVDLIPDGWIYQNMANALNAPSIGSSLNMNERRIDPLKAAEIQKQFNDWGGRNPYRFYAKLALPEQASWLRWAAKHQTMLHLTAAACGLERFRIRHRSYPENLDRILPLLTKRLPNDLFNGQPLKYSTNGTNAFLIYSVGWDAKDDGGSGNKAGFWGEEWKDVDGDWPLRSPSQ